MKKTIILIAIALASCNYRVITLYPDGSKKIEIFDRSQVRNFHPQNPDSILKPIKVILIPHFPKNN